MKYSTREKFDNYLAIVCAILLAILLIISTDANAWNKPTKEPTTKVELNQKQTQAQTQGQIAKSESKSKALSDADSSSKSNSVSSVDGNEYTSNSDDDTNLYALGLTFPSLAGCIGGGQGGVNDRGRGGFLGLNLTNVACWMQQLSQSESDLEVRARLRCHDKHYRRAMTFDVRGNRKDKTRACIDFVIPRWTEELRAERAVAEEHFAKLQREHEIEKEELVAKCSEANARRFEACQAK